MEKSILQVEGMTCEHCVNSISGALTELDGVETVEVSLSAKTVTVAHDKKVTLDLLKQEIEDIGYDVL